MGQRTITARWEEIYDDAVRRRARASGRSLGILLHRDAEDLDPDRAPAGREGAGVTPEAARHETLAAAVAAAAAVTDEWFVVPAHTDDHPTVVLPIAARRPFLEQLVERRPAGLRLRARAGAQGLASRRGLPAEVVPGVVARPHRPAVPRAVAAGRGRRSHLGTGCAVAVEFWEEGPGRRPALPRPGGVHDRGAARRRDGGPPASTASRCAPCR